MPKSNTLSAIIDANLESIEQGENLILSLTAKQYQYKATPLLNSSIGEHFRHISDSYFSLMEGAELGHVDFNRRRRGALVETRSEVALAELSQIKTWLLHINSDVNKTLSIKTEVALKATCVVDISSSLARELLFTSSHAVHHYAVIAVIAKLQNVGIDSGLGLAAATATNVRKLQSSNGLLLQ